MATEEKIERTLNVAKYELERGMVIRAYNRLDELQQEFENDRE